MVKVHGDGSDSAGVMKQTAFGIRVKPKFVEPNINGKAKVKQAARKVGGRAQASSLTLELSLKLPLTVF
jgi:hypothetical protein